MTSLLLISYLMATRPEIAGQIPPPLLAPRINLSTPGFSAGVTDFAVDGLGNRYINGRLSLPSTFWTSNDGGRTWGPSAFTPSTVGVYPPRQYFSTQITVDPVDSSVLYDCGNDGVFRSNDGGRLWYRLREGGCASLAVDAINRNIVLASLSNRLIRSVDGGNSWTALPYEGQRLVRDPAGFGNVALLSPNQRDYWLSNDRGVNWRRETLPEASTQLAFDPPNRLGCFWPERSSTARPTR